MQILHMGKLGHGKVRQCSASQPEVAQLERGVIFSTAECLRLLQASFVAPGREIQARVDLVLRHSSISCVLMGRKDLCWSTHL